MFARAIERGTKWALAVWRDLSLDAKVIGGLAVANWMLLFRNHGIVQATTEGRLWQLFPGIVGPLWLLLCGALAFAYPFRDRRYGVGFTRSARVLHLAAIVAAFVILPAIAAIVLRETGRPYTYVHDGAIMVEEAARKLLAGQNPYVADYLDTPLYHWPMINNPALYHFTYFPLVFLVTVPFVLAFDRLGIFWDQRYLYLPAYVAMLAVLPTLVPARAPRAFAQRLALVTLVGLSPMLFPFVAEGRNDAFVLLFLFAGIALLLRERRTLGTLAIAAASAAKLHAVILLPFLAIYLLATRRPRTLREAWRALWVPGWPAAALLVLTFGPFLANDLAAFYDDLVRYNAGGAAWSYPISGLGFSALLLRLGMIEYPQQDFPFAAFQLAVGLPVATLGLLRLWREPTLARLLAWYTLTLIASLFFARYFHGNHLGFILAIASPIPFLAPFGRRRAARRRGAVPVHVGPRATAPVHAASVEPAVDAVRMSSAD